MRKLAARLRCERGLTLTELLFVMVFLGVISAAFSMVLSSTIRHESEIQEQSLTQDDIRSAVDRMMRDVRSAYSTTGWPIEVSTTSQLTVTVPDKAGTPVLGRVSYRVSSGNLQRAFGLASAGTPTNWVTLVPNVTSATPFSYTDYLGAATTTASAVRTVSIALTFATKIGSGRTYAFTSSASPRMSP